MDKNFRFNILFNYLAQIITIVISVIYVPIYLSNLGPEAYGVIGFFSSLQMWFLVLDFGFSQTIIRETTKYFSDPSTNNHFFKYLKFIFTIFFYIAILGTAIFIFVLPIFSNYWIEHSRLASAEIERSLLFMGGAVIIRWFQSFFRGIITGKQMFVSLSLINIGGIIFRFPIVLYLIKESENPLTQYFIYQIAFSLFELLILIFMSFDVFKSIKISLLIRKKELVFLKKNIYATGKIGITTLLWLVVTQADRFLLSAILPLKKYGYFSTITSLCGGVAVLSTPILSTMLPKFTELSTKSCNQELSIVFNKVFQIIVFLVGAAVITLSLIGHSFLILWTKNHELATLMTPTMIIYLWAILLGAINSLLSNLNIAWGELNMNLKLMYIQTLSYLFLFFLLSTTVGTMGAGIALLVANLIYLFFVSNFVFKKLEIDRNKYLLKNFITPLGITTIVCFLVFKELEILEMAKSYQVILGSVISMLSLLLLLQEINRMVINKVSEVFVFLQRS